jgi:tetratricopeptide (TPR) repeat protein
MALRVCFEPFPIQAKSTHMLAKWRKRHGVRTLLSALALVLTACEGVGIPATDDPYAKISQADYLMHRSGRIMQARRMLDQAIVLFEQRGDKAGLAQAYREYGLLALLGGANADPVVLILQNPKGPFRPTSEELDLSDGYLNRALGLAQDTKQLYLVANINFVLGNNQVRRGTPQNACPYYNVALKGFREAETDQPGAVLYLPAGVKNPAEFVERAKREAGCER